MSTIGEDGLANLFSLSSKQLHYILVNLDSNGLVKRHNVAATSDKKRSHVHLARFAVRKKTLLETMCDYLMSVGERADGGASHEACCDSLKDLRINMGLTQKKFKNVLTIAERTNMVKIVEKKGAK